MALQIHNAMLTNRTHAGCLIHLEQTIIPVCGVDGAASLFVAVWQDHTEAQQQAKERQRLEEQLRQLQKMQAVGQLTAGITHNFNNMLMGILSNLESVQSSTLETAALVADTESICLRAADIVKQLMLFSGNSGQAQLQQIDLVQIIDRSVDMGRRTFDRQITLHWEPPEPVHVRADATQLEQALLNLLLNARDALTEAATPKARVGIRVVVAPDTHPEDSSGPFGRVDVEDNGPGIEPAVQSRLFDPFFTTKGPDRGTGLGLSTVYAIMEEHGGWVEVDSEPGIRTTFSLFVPLAQEGTPAPLLGPQATAPDAPVDGSETILVVEDEETVCLRLVGVLERNGYRVLVASDGVEGWELFSEHAASIDVILLDLSLPRLSGRELLDQLRAVRPDVPVIISTGLAQADLDSLDIQGVLHKPYRLAKAMQTIRQLLDDAAGSPNS